MSESNHPSYSKFHLSVEKTNLKQSVCGLKGTIFNGRFHRVARALGDTKEEGAWIPDDVWTISCSMMMCSRICFKVSNDKLQFMLVSSRCCTSSSQHCLGRGNPDARKLQIEDSVSDRAPLVWEEPSLFYGGYSEIREREKIKTPTLVSRTQDSCLKKKNTATVSGTPYTRFCTSQMQPPCLQHGPIIKQTNKTLQILGSMLSPTSVTREAKTRWCGVRFEGLHLDFSPAFSLPRRHNHKCPACLGADFHNF